MRSKNFDELIPIITLAYGIVGPIVASNNFLNVVESVD